MRRVLHIGLGTDADASNVIGVLAAAPVYEHDLLVVQSRPLGVASVRARLRRGEIKARAREADVAHVHGLALNFVRRMLGEVPTVWSTHGMEEWLRRLPPPLRGLVIQKSARNVSEVVCSTEAEAELLRAAAPELDSRLEVVPWGLPKLKRSPAARWETRRRLGIPDEQVVVLTIEGMTRGRGMRLAMAAVDTARSGGDDISLLVITGGKTLTRSVRSGGEHVRTVGFGDDPFRVLAAGDIFLVPSSYRGHGFALRAAMIYGLPIVAGRSRSHGEVLGDTSVLVPLDRVQVASTLVDLTRNPARREWMAGMVRRRAFSEYSAAKSRSKMLDVYERAVRGG